MHTSDIETRERGDKALARTRLSEVKAALMPARVKSRNPWIIDSGATAQDFGLWLPIADCWACRSDGSSFIVRQWQTNRGRESEADLARGGTFRTSTTPRLRRAWFIRTRTCPHRAAAAEDRCRATWERSSGSKAGSSAGARYGSMSRAYRTNVQLSRKKAFTVFKKGVILCSAVGWRQTH